MADAPITQDVLTIPRKLPEGEKRNLIGLTRAELREALISVGTPEKQVKMRVNQVWQWLYFFGGARNFRHNARSRKRDVTAAQTDAFPIHRNFHRIANRCKVIKWLSHSHQNNIAQQTRRAVWPLARLWPFAKIISLLMR